VWADGGETYRVGRSFEKRAAEQVCVLEIESHLSSFKKKGGVIALEKARWHGWFGEP